MHLDNLQDKLTSLLQKDVQFNLKTKTLKEGKILLFNVKDFYITFTLKTKKDLVKTYEIPMPFDVFTQGRSVVFDYSVRHISKNDIMVQTLITLLQNKIGKKSKFFNNTLTIEY
tara:strand:- start:94 stop:435 length:342 start_codon:yes stop_codon:yes gene_type:complete